MIKEKLQHIPILDNLRAVAALSVCIYHFVCGPINFVTNKPVLNIFTFGAYGVQFFFVISGFIIPWSIYNNNYKIKNYFKFLLKRFIRLEPPYIISILLVVGLFLLRKNYTQVPDSRYFTMPQLFLHLGYLIPFTNYKWLIDVYWTLAIEFQFYLFMGLFYFIIVNKKAAMRFAGYVFVLALSFIGTEKFLLYWLPVFLLGNLLFLFLTEQINKTEFYMMTIVTFIYISFFLPLPVLFSSFISFSAILFFRNYSNTILAWLGKISYSIYLIHTIVGTAIINILSHHAHSSLQKIGVVIAGVAVSIVFSYLMFIIVEKPSKRLSSKIKFDIL
jgi:peptidoglycan/LPS O-acetylase OafA/YrhL